MVLRQNRGADREGAEALGAFVPQFAATKQTHHAAGGINIAERKHEETVLIKLRKVITTRRSNKHAESNGYKH